LVLASATSDLCQLVLGPMALVNPQFAHKSGAASPIL